MRELLTVSACSLSCPSICCLHPLAAGWVSFCSLFKWRSLPQQCTAIGHLTKMCLFFQYSSCLLSVNSKFFWWDARYHPWYLEDPPPTHRHIPSTIQSSSPCGNTHYPLLLHCHLPTSVLHQCQFCPAEPIYSNYLSFPPAACFPTGRISLLLNAAQSMRVHALLLTGVSP